MSKLACWACLLAAALGAAGCGGDEDSGGADEAGPVHVHGLGINPADGSLFVATHTGLWRVEPEGGPARRVGGSRQDTMGFTVVGEDRFLASGHPELAQMEEDDAPPHLGLIESRNAGEDWEHVSLRGQADFHVLRTAGEAVYGFDSSHGRLLASTDGGGSWAGLTAPEPLVDLALQPGDPRRLLAAGQGGLHSSDDGGLSWEPHPQPPGLLAWPAADLIFLLRHDGQLLRASDRRGPWVPAGRVEGEPAALLATGRGELYVALHDGTILRSADDGRTFATHSAPA